MNEQLQRWFNAPNRNSVGQKLPNVVLSYLWATAPNPSQFYYVLLKKIEMVKDMTYRKGTLIARGGYVAVYEAKRLDRRGQLATDAVIKVQKYAYMNLNRQGEPLEIKYMQYLAQKTSFTPKSSTAFRTRAMSS